MKKQKKIESCTASVPRLLSVVEIITREYRAELAVGELGLHQYNELGTLEDLGLASPTQPLDPMDAAIAGNNLCVV